ncbi:SIS domain-containing protein [Brevibacillus fulvus]|uniref:Arabinose-5-phosphate isomerase n=1 Tax=Brevibacillus fulvus TaxID=1125967 RepID=A0A939BRL7_9BACL|nr:SIS domain-containing protein [Brevibacillus fulvus]MBM7589593.1 arabinose-5-phosphate isomerase [Brevibacillus fulvus]
MIQYFEELMGTLDDAIHSMDERVFRKLVEDSVRTIQSGHKIIVSGLGKNVPICEKFTGSMLSLGMDAYFLHTNSAIHGDMGVIKDGDLVIILTKSGETAESVYLVDLLADRNITMWLLSFNPDSSLTRKIPNSLILHLKHEGDLWNIMPNNSTTLNLIVLQGLVMHIAKELNIQIDRFKRNHPGGHIGAVLSKEVIVG